MSEIIASGSSSIENEQLVFARRWLTDARDLAKRIIKQGTKHSQPINKMINLIDKVIDEIDCNKTSRLIYVRVFEIGSLYGKYIQSFESRFTYDELVEHYKAYVADVGRQQPLKFKQISSAALREIGQKYAAQLWQENSEKRLSDVCLEVQVFIYDWLGEAEEKLKDSEEDIQILKQMRELLPNKAEDIKPWLRKIAPPAARRPGRPKENGRR